jgi:hypothetical protein
VDNPFAGLLPANAAVNGAKVSRGTLITPHPQFTGITLQATNAASFYFESMDVRLEKRYSHGVTVLANFTYSNLISQDNYKNATDSAPEKRVDSDDRPLRFILSGSYELPFGRGKQFDAHSRIANRIIGGWVLDAIYTNQIGALLTFANNLIFLGGPLNANPHPSNLDLLMFNTSNFVTSSTAQLGSNINPFGSRYGNVRQDGADNVDLSMIKDTAITERVKLQFRFEAFHAFNRPESARSPTTRISRAESRWRSGWPGRANFGDRLHNLDTIRAEFRGCVACPRNYSCSFAALISMMWRSGSRMYICGKPAVACGFTMRRIRPSSGASSR